MSKRVLFTGIPGVRLGPCLVKFAERRGLPKEAVVCAEKYLHEEAAKSGTLESSSAEGPERTIEALGVPKELLRRAWCDAFRRLDTELNRDGDLFLHAHACFYHQRTRELFCLVDEGLVRDLFRPDMVITLIDDVEEVCARLRESGQMFHDLSRSERGFASLATTCQQLGLIMQWRATDFAFAEFLARRLKVPHLLLAVKHPMTTLESLLYQPDRPVVYLSHPISEPRRQRANGDEPGFNDFCMRLSDVTDRLRQATTLLEPTTVDEFRFRRFKVSREAGSETVYLPALTERWPLTDRVGSILSADPRHETAAEQIFGQFDCAALDDYERWKSVPPGAAEHNEPPADLLQIDNACHLIHALVGDIEDHIAARDLKLVEQAQRLVVVRPLYRGNESSGVTAEIEHFCRVVGGGLRPDGRIRIFTTEDDELQWRIGEISAWLEEKTQVPKDTWQSDVAQLDPAILTGKTKALVAKVAEIAMKRDAPIIQRESRTLGPAQALSGLESRASLARELEARLVPAYHRTIESFRAAGAQIDVQVQSGTDWPEEPFLREVIDAGKEDEATREGDRA